MKAIIDTFISISKPFKNGTGLKEKAIIDFLKKYNASYVKKVGIVIPSIKKTKLVLSTSMDLIKSFNEAFEKSHVCLIEEDKITGALDNSLMNAFLIESIIQLREKGLAQDVEFVFSEGKYSGFSGIKEYVRDNSKKPFFIHLGLSSEAQKSGTINYDYPNFNICKQIYSQNFNILFSNERRSDDITGVLALGGLVLLLTYLLKEKELLLKLPQILIFLKTILMF